MKKQSKIAQIAIFFAIMLVLHLLSSVIFNLLPVPIKPTIIHIPIIIASILYGPQVGMVLGFLMGCISVITNTIVLIPSSYLFSPFVPNGNLHSLIIAMVPRILIGLTPYLVYKVLHNKLGLAIAGAVGKYIHVGLYKAIDKQKVFEGTLVSFEEDELTMEYMDKTRKKTVQIPYSLVSKARLAVKL